MERFDDDNPQNLYVIRRQLSIWPMLPGEDSWEMTIGHFRLNIRLTNDDYWQITDGLRDRDTIRNIKILDYKKFDVFLYEQFYRGNQSQFLEEKHLELHRDPRFRGYESIQYRVITTLSGAHLNQSNGDSMPLLQLMELIRYLHRLSKLTAFM